MDKLCKDNIICCDDNCKRCANLVYKENLKLKEQIKQKELTFKEELTLEADNNAIDIDISEHIREIKKRMKNCVDCRSYTIALNKINTQVCIGTNCRNITILSIPHLVSPLHYRQLFINELIKLGFTEECMELSVREYDTHDAYDIKLTW